VAEPQRVTPARPLIVRELPVTHIPAVIVIPLPILVLPQPATFTYEKSLGITPQIEYR